MLSNEKRTPAEPPFSLGTGFNTLDERCRLLLGRGIEIVNEPAQFTVRVPLERAIAPLSAQASAG